MTDVIIPAALEVLELLRLIEMIEAAAWLL